MEKSITPDFNKVEQTYTVQVERHPETGNKISEKWLMHNFGHVKYNPPILSRDDDLPAEQRWNPRTGVCYHEAYYTHGVLDRRGGPALIYRDLGDGEVFHESWMCGGGYHREGDLPAKWDKNLLTGVIEQEEYFDGGIRHRDGGKPAVIMRHWETGKVFRLEYYKDGNLDRIDENPRQELSQKPIKREVATPLRLER